jgi:AcrR family transcriptional regulator
MINRKTARRIKQSPKLPAEERRRQLLDAARKLFVKKGYRATTTAEIAAEAGLTKGALYFHFRSKEDILFDLVKRLSDHNRAVFEESLKKADNPAAFLRVLLDLRKDRCHGGHWDMVDLWVQAMRIRRIKQYTSRRMREVLRLFVEQADASPGSSPEELQQLAVFVLGLHHGISFMEMLSPSTVDIKAQVKLFERLLGRYRGSGAKRKPGRGKKKGQ